MIKQEYLKIANRFAKVMNIIGCEFLDITDERAEVLQRRDHYCTENGVTINWMKKEVDYWLSCYYESGNVRCDDRFGDKYGYKIWVSETGYLKRLKKALEKYEDAVIEEWR